MELDRIVTEIESGRLAGLLQRMAAAPTSELPNLWIETVVGRFDLAWGVMVQHVNTYEQVAICEQELGAAADRLYKWFCDRLAGQHGLAWVCKGDVYANLKLRLAASVARWRAEA